MSSRFGAASVAVAVATRILVIPIHFALKRVVKLSHVSQDVVVSGEKNSLKKEVVIYYSKSLYRTYVAECL